MIEIREMVLQATVKGVFIGDKDSLETTPVEKAYITWDGFKGDKHIGRTRLADAREDDSIFPRGCEIANLRQFSAVSVEDLQAIASVLTGPAIQAEWLGANILFEGIPCFSSLPSGTEFILDRYAVLVIAHENTPCRNPGEIIQKHLSGISDIAAHFVKCAMGRRGVVGFVKRPGIIRRGSTVTVKIPRQVLYMPKTEFVSLKTKRYMPTTEEAEESLKKLIKEF